MSKIAFIYPGQGAQKAGMGRDFYENSPLAAKLYDQASQALGLDMKALCFEENEKLDLTEYTQAALVTTCTEYTSRSGFSWIFSSFCAFWLPCSASFSSAAVFRFCTAEPNP